MRLFILIIYLFLLLACKNFSKEAPITSRESDLDSIPTKDFREFKVLDSKVLTNSQIWNDMNPLFKDFKEEDYQRLKPYILERDITELQVFRAANKFTYEELTKFYLYRIRKYDRENALSLNSVISLNVNVLSAAANADIEFLLYGKGKHPIHGMPILLKDNINTKNLPTTAGAVALKTNFAEDAFIVKQLKDKGAIILGKANLSEWAYFFCGDCPSGYSAIGGQTLNPYGRRKFDTGGSSSGSGVAVAANFCVAAVGTETSGSILSPSSQNSIVGLKPTIGLVSRSGIIPISSTLDTAGPMAKSVRDNGILLDAIYGFDQTDFKSIDQNKSQSYFQKPFFNDLRDKRFGVFKSLLEDSLYVKAIADLKAIGATIVEIEEEKIDMPGFLTLLNLDMRKDLPLYFSNYADASISFKSVQEVIDFNKKDSLERMPYGQKLFEDLVADETTEVELENIKKILKSNGRHYFDENFMTHNLDAFLSINNYHAGYAAVAEYPALTVPMGYTDAGEPKGLTFIGRPFCEKELLAWAYHYEQKTSNRKMPKNYY